MGLMQSGKAWIKTSNSVFARTGYKAIQKFFLFRYWAEYLLTVLLFYVFRVFPLQDKLVASNFSGKRYGDNTKEIVEYLRAKDPTIQLVWVVNRSSQYPLPNCVKRVYRDNIFSMAYHYTTAKVWVDTHVIPVSTRKRKGQLFIETWHGGLGIKKILNNRNETGDISGELAGVRHMNRLADVFISNSNHLSSIYRSAFGYTGPIWKCGYPKNDRYFSNAADARKRVREQLDIPAGANIVLYAPTFRLGDSAGNPYDVAHERIVRALHDRFGGTWFFLLRLHPIAKKGGVDFDFSGDAVRDVTDYPDFQELVLACDAFLTDYSSGIFDAALRGVPCFIYANDFEIYEKQNGVYYQLDELPFPCATSNEDLISNIEQYDRERCSRKWESFKERTGLSETGRATQEISDLIAAFIHGDTKVMEEKMRECEE